MSDLERLSAKKLHAVISRAEAHWSLTLDATIAAGMGSLRFTDMVELAKGSSLLSRTKLAMAYLNACRDHRVALDELDRRMRYHGSDKPIKHKN